MKWCLSSRLLSLHAHGLADPHVSRTDERQLHQFEEELCNRQTGCAANLERLQQDVPDAAEQCDRVGDSHQNQEPRE